MSVSKNATQIYPCCKTQQNWNIVKVAKDCRIRISQKLLNTKSKCFRISETILYTFLLVKEF